METDAFRLQRNGSSSIKIAEIKKRRLSEKQIIRAVVSGWKYRMERRGEGIQIESGTRGLHKKRKTEKGQKSGDSSVVRAPDS